MTISLTELLFIILATAILTSALTATILLIAIRKWKRDYSDEYLEHAGDIIGAKVKEGVIAAVEEEFPELQARVKAGIIQGIAEVTDISPDVQNAVDAIRSGIRDSLGMLDIFGATRMGRPTPPKNKR